MSEQSTGKRRMWPTPQANDSNRSPEAWLAAQKRHAARGVNLQMSLVVAAQMDTQTYVQPVSRQLTFSAEGFHVNPIPLRDDAKDLPTTATSGASSPDSFAKLGPDGSWLKTCQGYCQVNLDGSLDEFCETWPRSGCMSNGTAYLQVPLAPLTGEIGSGSSRMPWATPTTAIAEGTNASGSRGRRDLRRDVRMFPTPCTTDAKSVPYQKGKDGKRYPMLLGAVRPETMWPRLNSEGLLPTPVSTDTGSRKHEYSQGGMPLSLSVGGQLNPTWVEWLMGYPEGWTVLED